MTIKIHIERVILEGVSARHPRLLQQALESELAESISEGGLSEELLGGGARASLPGGVVRLDGTHDPRRIGAAIARGAYQAFGWPETGPARRLGGKSGPEQRSLRRGGDSR